MILTRRGLLLALPLAAAACGLPREFSPPLESWEGQAALADGPRQMRADDETTWNQIWFLTGEGTAPRPLGAGEVAVGIFLGSRPTAGYSLSLEGRAEGSDRFVVRWREVLPTSGDVVATVVTHPWIVGVFQLQGRHLHLLAGY